MRISWLNSCPPLSDPENVSPTVPGRLVKMKVWSCRPHLNWQSLERLSAYCRAHFRRGRREERRLRCDFHPLRLVANLQREIDRHHLRDWHKNTFGYFSLETLLLCLQAISAGRHSHPVVAGTACFGRPLHVGFNVRNGERGVGNNGTTRVQNRTGDGTEVALPRRRA